MSDCLPDYVEDFEAITRFAFQSGHHSLTELKWKAFEPRNGELSIFRVHEMGDAEIWDIGINHVGKLQKRPPKCRKDFLVKIVRELGLDVVSETKSHPRHGNIIHWPEHESEVLLMSKKVAAAVNSPAALKFPP